MEEIVDQQDEARNGDESAEQRTSEVHRSRGYRSQRELEEINAELSETNGQLREEIAQLEKDKQEWFEQYEKVRDQLETARENIGELAEQLRASEAESLALLRENRSYLQSIAAIRQQKRSEQ